jgi:hypothetical protein
MKAQLQVLTPVPDPALAAMGETGVATVEAKTGFRAKIKRIVSGQPL